MKIHEYQSREILSEAGIPVPDAYVVSNPDKAARAYTQLAKKGHTVAVVKAQVHAGGRGKGGGVKLVKSAKEARQAASEILSKPLVTPQTGPEGVPVYNLMIAAGVSIHKEYYLSIVVDRNCGRPVLIASSEGGMDIEEVAASRPDAIIRERIDPVSGLHPYQVRKLAYTLGFKGQQVRQAAGVMGRLAKLFISKDASLVEINPLVVTEPDKKHPDGQVIALDAKMDFDDNALERQSDLVSMRDTRDTDPSEIRAEDFGLSYIKLDGNIGCLVNGAGLAMSTMDIIKHHGGEPANFLDVGGSASQEAVTEAFRIILSDASVKGIFVNIFGGIAKCDVIAKAIVAAANEIGFSVPLAVRLEGTNVEAAREILEKAKDNIPTLIPCSDLTDGAQKIVDAVTKTN